MSNSSPKHRRGGYRPGSGIYKGFKFPSTMKRQAVQEKFIELVTADLGEFYEKMRQLALGDLWLVKQIGKNQDNTPVFKSYKLPPDPKALEFLIERVTGKPIQPIDGKLENPGMIELAQGIKKILETKPK